MPGGGSVGGQLVERDLGGGVKGGAKESDQRFQLGRMEEQQPVNGGCQP